MLVVDVETSGTESSIHGILSVGAVDFENPKRQFYEECRLFDGAHVMKEALEINGFTERDILDKNKKTDKELVEAFLEWALLSDNHTLAGQNPSFDRDFLRAAALRYHLDWPLAHRTVDTHSVCFAVMITRGDNPPAEKGRSALDLDVALRYAGLPDEPMPHNALCGAKLESELLSRLLYKRVLFEEYSKFKIPN
ncbi:MAG: 3'-5' exonuclease [bacterium]|nr:3'-5' exonuclease [bacterium]